MNKQTLSIAISLAITSSITTAKTEQGNNQASSDSAVVFGDGNIVSGLRATAVGTNNKAIV